MCIHTEIAMASVLPLLMQGKGWWSGRRQACCQPGVAWAEQALPASGAGHPREAGVAAGAWLCGEPEVPLSLAVELFLATSLAFGLGAQPASLVDSGRRADAAVEILPTAKELQVLLKTVNKKHSEAVQGGLSFLQGLALK